MGLDRQYKSNIAVLRDKVTSNIKARDNMVTRAFNLNPRGSYYSFTVLRDYEKTILSVSYTYLHAV